MAKYTLCEQTQLAQTSDSRDSELKNDTNGKK